MRLDRPFVQLPLRVDAARLAAELAAIDESAWRDHPEGAPGNTALPLVAAGGDPDDDSTRGPMAPTPVLAQLPYTRQVLAGLHTTIGRTRFMRIADETELHTHVDTNYYWWHHVRVHVPIVTTPEVVFEVGGGAWRPNRVPTGRSSSSRRVSRHRSGSDDRAARRRGIKAMRGADDGSGSLPNPAAAGGYPVLVFEDDLDAARAALAAGDSAPSD